MTKSLAEARRYAEALRPTHLDTEGVGMRVTRSDLIFAPAVLMNRPTDQVLVLNSEVFTQEQAEALDAVLAFPSQRNA